jgi:hypothetical protein
MPSAAVEAAFRDHLAANWNTANGVILGVNEVFEPPSDGSPFLLIQYPISNAKRTALTRHRFEEGAARIILNAPTGGGLPIWLALADTIAAAFRGDKLIFDGVEVFEPSPPIVNDNNDDGNYFELAVIVPYRFQFNVAGADSP